MSQYRKKVLEVFKQLHRTRQHVFQNDARALEAGRNEINKNFKHNMKEENPEEIKKMIQFAKDVDVELRTNVIQAEQKADDVFQLRITPETTRLDNVPFNEAAIIEKPRRKRKGSEGGCGGCGGSAGV